MKSHLPTVAVCSLRGLFAWRRLKRADLFPPTQGPTVAEENAKKKKKLLKNWKMRKNVQSKENEAKNKTQISENKTWEKVKTETANRKKSNTCLILEIFLWKIDFSLQQGGAADRGKSKKKELL